MPHTWARRIPLAGRIAEAVPLLEQVVERATAFGSMLHQPFSIATLSEAHLLAGRLEDASSLAERALELSRTHRERGNQAWVLRLLGDIAIHRNPPDIDQAETHYQQALTLATELGMRPLQAHCYRSLGTLYCQTGQSEQAHAELSRAIDMYRDMEMVFWLPETEAALAAVESR